MALWYWDQACLSCSGGIFEVASPGPHLLGGWGEVLDDKDDV